MSKKIYKLSAIAIVKNEAEYLDEWICYHKLIGFEHFYIFNNNSEDDIAVVLRKYIVHGIVTLIDWPFMPGQDDAYNYALKIFGHTSKWMALFDVDEFFLLKNNLTIPEFLEKFPDADQVLIFWRLFGHSGHKIKPKGMIISNFLKCAESLTNISKAIVRPEKVIFASPHNCVTHTQLTINDVGRPLKETWRHQDISEENLVINHYFSKSYSEYEKKILKGQVDGRSEKKLDPFEKWDFSHLDSRAAMYADNVIAEYERINCLSASPISFASQSQLSQHSSQRGILLLTQKYVEGIARNLNEELFNSTPLKLDHYYFGTCLQFPKITVDLESRCVQFINQGLLSFFESCNALAIQDCLGGEERSRLTISNAECLDGGGKLRLNALNDDPQINFDLNSMGDPGKYALAFILKQPIPSPIDAMVFGHDYHDEECMGFRTIHHESEGMILCVISIGGPAMYANKIRLDPGSTEGEYEVPLLRACRFI
jgi:hypothetical protein